MIVFKQKGDFKPTEQFLQKASKLNIASILERHAKEGVNALSANTPVDSGLTASSWGYEIRISEGSSSIIWTNSNIENGVPIAIVLQYGHGTGTGGYVQGRDYINPVMRPIFDKIAAEIQQEVMRL